MDWPFPFDPNRYGPEVAELLREERLPELGPGQPVLYCCQRFTDRPSRFVFRIRRVG
jgi:hypothetical protein